MITIDTSRVALALARTRLMAGRHPPNLLRDSREGAAKQAELTARAALNTALGKAHQEWQVRRTLPDTAPPPTREAHAQFWQARRERQQQMDAFIARNADTEFLHDRLRAAYVFPGREGSVRAAEGDAARGDRCGCLGHTVQRGKPAVPAAQVGSCRGEGHYGDEALSLVLEVKGERDAADDAKHDTIQRMWVPAVNADGRFGRWAFLRLDGPYEIGRAIDDCTRRLND